MSVRIGIDFDNTLVGYDALFARLARERGWLRAGAASSKAGVKRALVRADGHDLRWQRLQADAYGHRILEARAFPGALEFLARAERDGHEVFVVSHKSERSHLDPSVRLRDWARRWLKQGAPGLPPGRVLFASTRAEKVRLIDRLALDVFIDDLPEVLSHPGFPKRTDKILFDPALSWKGVARRVDVIALIGADAAAAIEDALGRRCVRAAALKSSGNNRLFRVELQGGRRVLVKRYLVDKRDGRPRARTEFEGLALLWKAGLREIPEPLRLDPQGRFGVYSWLEGKPLKRAVPTDAHVRQAASFLRRLRAVPARSWTAPAADARASLSDYAAHIRRRLARVRAGAKALGDAEARRFVENEVTPAAEAVISRLKRDAGAAWLGKSERFLSPSDFGLHNAILGSDGKIRFIDFEYFGWDDPAKLVADLFHHAGQKPLSSAQRELFLREFCRGWKGAPAFRRRLGLVLEPIAMEWILIILNVLSPETLERRRFADPSLDPKRLVAQRLRAARLRLHRIPTC